jgi:hypothetical protein
VSALRIAAPGQPIRHIDLGPSVGRRSFTRGAVYGGVLVTPIAPKPLPVAATSPERRAQMKAYKDEHVACGFVMPRTSEKCARRKGHGANDHRSRRNLDDIARRRWAPV